MNETINNITEDVVSETAVDVVTKSGSNWKAIGIGAGIMAGVVALGKFVIKPGIEKIAQKIAAKKAEKNNTADVEDNE